MKPKTQIIIFTVVVILLSSVFWHYATAQSKLHTLGGYKSLEIGFTYTNEESELIYGVSASVVDSEVSEKRANRNDKGKNHEFSNDIVPALFLNIGAKFDYLSIIGKIGGAYVDQTINGNPEPQKAYLAFGLGVGYQISDTIGLRGSFDSVNSVLVGVSFNL